MTYEQEQHWKSLGVEAIDAEQERLLAIWLEKRCGNRFQVRQLCVVPSEDYIGTHVAFRGTRLECKIAAGRLKHCWVEHEDQPAIVPNLRRPRMTDRLRRVLGRAQRVAATVLAADTFSDASTSRELVSRTAEC